MGTAPRPTEAVKKRGVMKRLIAIGTAAFALSAPSAARAASCEDMAKLALPHVTVDSATLVAPGAFTPPAAPGAAPAQAAASAPSPYRSLPAFCRVALTSKPSADSDIKIEVWLPQTGWNGKFQGVGNGGWAGVISYSALAEAVTAGYAAASTDTGHVGNTAKFAMESREKMVDMGYRAIHEMTVQGKAVTNAFFAKNPTLSFFNGCSQGGRQGLTEAMRYPADYNGIISGAPAIYYMQILVARTAMNAMANRNPAAVIGPEKYPAVHEAVLNACDTLDGVKDGVLENPLQCRFDPKVLECKGADGPTCLTPPQVDTMRQLYAPQPVGKAGTIPPVLQHGTELGWGTIAGPRVLGTSLEAMKYIVFKDPAWDGSKFNPATDFDRAMLADSDKLLSLTDPNLKPFFDRGGKLIIWHGWQDQQVPAQSATTYFNDVLKTVGRNAAGNSIQLYMMPGVNHCRSGPGPDTFDKMAAIESFVATGKSPAQIVASHITAGKVDRTRPLCPFGQVAKYKGTGSTDEAANFSCAAETTATGSR